MDPWQSTTSSLLGCLLDYVSSTVDTTVRQMDLGSSPRAIFGRCTRGTPQDVSCSEGGPLMLESILPTSPQGVTAASHNADKATVTDHARESSRSVNSPALGPSQSPNASLCGDDRCDHPRRGPSGARSRSFFSYSPNSHSSDHPDLQELYEAEGICKHKAPFSHLMEA